MLNQFHVNLVIFSAHDVGNTFSQRSCVYSCSAKLVQCKMSENILKRIKPLEPPVIQTWTSPRLRRGDRTVFTWCTIRWMLRVSVGLYVNLKSQYVIVVCVGVRSLAWLWLNHLLSEIPNRVQSSTANQHCGPNVFPTWHVFIRNILGLEKIDFSFPWHWKEGKGGDCWPWEGTWLLWDRFTIRHSTSRRLLAATEFSLEEQCVTNRS